MMIYSKQTKKMYTAKEMDNAEKNRWYGEKYNYIIGCDALSEQEIKIRIHEKKQLLDKRMWFHKRAGRIPVYFFEKDMYKSWFPVYEQGSLF